MNSPKSTTRWPLTVVPLIAALAAAGCETTLPDADDEAPEIRLVLSGGGIGSQTMSNPPTETWAETDGTQLFNLTSGAHYPFTLTVTDDGGVARVALRMPADISVTNLSPGVRDESGGLTRTLLIEGDRSSPRNALVISGRMTPSATSSTGFVFDVESEDFGSGGGFVNQRFMLVRAAVNPAP